MEGRRPRGEGLGGREIFPLDGALLGHRTLLDREQRLARLAVQQVQVPHLGGNREPGHRTVGAGEVEQDRLGRNIVVPDVVVHGAEVPDDLTAARVERHDRARVVVESLAMAAVVIR